MKSKEAIRNKIVHYANLVWETKNINHLNPLIHLMVEEICNELYLLDNKLNDIDSTILEKLVKNLAPSMFNYIRPAHGILQIKPDTPHYKLTNKTEFSLKELSSNLKNKGIKSVVFTPVTDIVLHNISIKHILHGHSLWSVNEYGERSFIANTDTKAAYNTVWLQLEAAADVKHLKELVFYIDFPHLNDSHDYYELLLTTKWTAAGKTLKAKQGLPLTSTATISKVEKDMLHFYESHFQTISDTLHFDDISLKTLPAELLDIIPVDVISSVPKELWVSITLPPHFEDEDLEKMIIALNAFPVLNRRYNEFRQFGKDLSDTISLPSEIGEEFVEIETVADSNAEVYSYYDTSLKREGTYTLTPVFKKEINDVRIYDYLERFIDVIQHDKIAFPEIDNEKIQEILNSISEIQDKENHKLELNRMNEYADVARLSVNMYDNTTDISVSYWTTLAEQINGLEAGSCLMANKIPALNKSDAVFLTTVTGARTFYDMESLKAINRFYLTSKDRILTKHDIISYCQIELGKYAESIDAARCVRISPKFKEGLINVMEVSIHPKERYKDYLNKKEVLRDLRTRLVKRSPDNYNYVFSIIN